ncbi:S41 family peptidase [Aureibacter tunicatorum]|uniref:Tail specific protease domain-containing protein n=1 Tax=Aureibacter tunicatorum TaxID=866807 RepID=A0AAE3XRJ8_9BACT|nr:S41 family peptidase [Aureibacter tunicatorum]MDR6241443.1 hypothetical protein [Aureibacter tunicatorum]BDD06712.1 hypothetical protein AUTU_41950 [Aureibacter tunicatorum]
MKIILLSIAFILIPIASFAQSIDDPISQQDMRKDLEIFKKTRIEANSGLYKYRTKSEIDSIYRWADNQIPHCRTILDFYKVITKLSDFEGSLHNDVSFSDRRLKSTKKENDGYFPYPIKKIDGKWLMNQTTEEIPLGSEIISINSKPINQIEKALYKYYSTDGINTSGKVHGLNSYFSLFYRYEYGPSVTFDVTYKTYESKHTESATIKSVDYTTQDKTNWKLRHSKPFENRNGDKKYSFKLIDSQTGLLTINTFGFGGKSSKGHKKYTHFLDSVFTEIDSMQLENLIVDIRENGGGNDPNDVVTYSYLTDRSFSENSQAWISFKKIPYVRYAATKIPVFLRPIAAIKYNKEFKKEFTKEINGNYYEDSASWNHKIRKPHTKAFKKNIYLLISPRVASAGSLFGAMLAGNKNTTVIGEEAMGGYYGHNGHIPFGYILPKSKIATYFFLVNLEQDVPLKENQIYNRGIIPDYHVSQTYEDYMNNVDTQMKYTLEMIKNSSDLQSNL